MHRAKWFQGVEKKEESERKQGKSDGNKNFKSLGKIKFIQSKKCWQCRKEGHFRSECPEEEDRKLGLVELGGMDSVRKANPENMYNNVPLQVKGIDCKLNLLWGNCK